MEEEHALFFESTAGVVWPMCCKRPITDHVNQCTEAYAFSYDPGSPQYKWLDSVRRCVEEISYCVYWLNATQDLANANNNRAVTPWIVVVGHRPMVRLLHRLMSSSINGVAVFSLRCCSTRQIPLRIPVTCSKLLNRSWNSILWMLQFGMLQYCII